MRRPSPLSLKECPMPRPKCHAPAYRKQLRTWHPRASCRRVTFRVDYVTAQGKGPCKLRAIVIHCDRQGCGVQFRQGVSPSAHPSRALLGLPGRRGRSVTSRKVTRLLGGIAYARPPPLGPSAHQSLGPYADARYAVVK